MKHLSIVLLFICFSAAAQPEGFAVEEIKKESHYVICKQKKKVGIYNNAKGEFTVEPHKGHLIHIPETQLILDVYPKEQKVDLYHYYDRTMQKFESDTSIGNFQFGHIMESQWDSKLSSTEVNKKDEHYFPKGTLLYVDKEDNYNYRQSSGLHYSFKGDYLIVNLKHENSVDNNPIAIPSQVFPSEDSIDHFGNIVYYSTGEQTVYKSGCFNLKTGQWDVPPKYEGVKEWKGIYGAYYWPEGVEFEHWWDGGIVYDFYQLEKSAIVPTEHIDYQGFAFPLDLWPFEGEEVWYDPDSIYVYHQNKKGVGMFKIPLSGKRMHENEYRRDWQDTEGRFDVKEIFPAEYEYIVQTGNVDYHNSPVNWKNYIAIAAKGENLFDILVINYAREEFSPNIDTLFRDVALTQKVELGEISLWSGDTTFATELVYVVDDTTILRYIPNPRNLNAKIIETRTGTDLKHLERNHDFDLQLYNKNVVVNSLRKEDRTYLIPIISTVHPNEDSLDTYGNYVYSLPEAGNYNSGIFNSERNEWFLKPNNYQIYLNNEGYLILKPVFLKENPKNLDYIVCDFLREDGTYAFQNLGLQELEQEKYWAYKISGYTANNIRQVAPYNKYLIYFDTDEGTGIASLNNFNSDTWCEPKALVKLAGNNTIFYLENDSLHLRMPEEENNENQPLEMTIPLDSGVYVQLQGFRARPVDYDMNQNKYHDYLSCVVKNGADLVSYDLSLKSKKPAGTNTVFIPQRDKSKFSFEEKSFLDNELRTEGVFWEFDIESMNSDLIYFRDNVPDNDELIGMTSLNYYGEDSIDANGNLVYYPPIPGYCHSGVYSKSQKKWMVEPQYISVEWMCDNIFLLQDDIRNDDSVLVGNKFILKKGDESFVFGDPDKHGETTLTEISKINDSLVLVNDYTHELESVPEFSIDNLEGYEFDENGNIIYTDPVPGIYKSGVLNVLSGQWVIKDENEYIWLHEKGFLVKAVEIGSDGLVSKIIYRLFSLSGDLIQDDVPLEEIDDRYK